MTHPQFTLLVVAYALATFAVWQEILNVLAGSGEPLAVDVDAPTLHRVGSFGVVMVTYGGRTIVIGEAA